MEANVHAHNYLPPATKDVLGGHLHQKVSETLSDNCIDGKATVYTGCLLVDKITGMLLERSVKDIHTMLQDDKLLFENMRRVIKVLHKECPHLPKTLPVKNKNESHKLSHEEVEEILYQKVCSIEEQMAPQITGMLLEMEIHTLHEFINDNLLLETAVTKAKQVLSSGFSCYLSASSSSSSSLKLARADRNETSGWTEELEQEAAKESIGQELFEQVLEVHPECASNLTGMIMELDLPFLKLLLGDKQLLQVAITRAYSEWTKHS